MSRATKLIEIYQVMRQAFGPSGWWPGDTPLEIMLGAVLTQNTAWTNVEKAISNLKAANLLEFSNLQLVSEAELAGLIRPAGYFRVKARRIKSLLAWLEKSCKGDLNRLESIDTSVLREELLGVNGIGPETADAILLYALRRPAFVVDEYTRRIFSRHGMLPPEPSYQDLRDFFTDVLPEDREMFGEYHAHLVEVGKNWCKRQNPDCANCPLQPFLEQEFYE